MQIIENLRKKGFDIEQALQICADDEDLYIEVLETALEEGESKLPIIENSIAIKDYARYHVEVHALKNAMKAIGAMELSDLSFEQEKAAKAEDYEQIEYGNQQLIDAYREVLEMIREVLAK